MVNVQKREDGLLDELSKLYNRQRLVRMQLTLWEYGYPEMKSFCDDVRACLEGADSE